jgi:hypothetical protein
MPVNTGPAFVGESSTSIVHRANGGIVGLREVSDDASRLSVFAFPFAAIKEVVASKSFALPGAYVLSGHGIVYLGESGQVGRRLLEHRDDPEKSFAREVFVVAAFNERWFDKIPAIYLQYYLTNTAETAGFVRVLKGASPRMIDLPAWRRAPLERIGQDAERLLFDAGCRAFHAAYGTATAVDQPNVIPFSAADETVADAADAGVMRIGVTTTPSGIEEYELSYGDIWARGYPSGDCFVVAAGSDVRAVLNPSVTPIIKVRREELNAAGVLTPIPGLADRLRLEVAVAFPSRAIAAKVLCGAHVDSSKWVPLNHAQPVILAM